LLQELQQRLDPGRLITVCSTVQEDAHTPPGPGYPPASRNPYLPNGIGAGLLADLAPLKR
jgi:hypothetical protein